MYVILFGFRLNLKDYSKGSSKRDTPKHRMKEPIHSCSNSPETIREEVDTLKTDFNRRVKHVLFNSIVAAYYMAFIPLCFAQVKYLFGKRYLEASESINLSHPPTHIQFIYSPFICMAHVHALCG